MPRAVPYLKPATPDLGRFEELKVSLGPAAAPQSTLGAVGTTVRVSGQDRFTPAHLVIPVDSAATVGIDPRTVRVFRLDAGTKTYHPVWKSGMNQGLGYVWATITRPGDYQAIGLPKDQLLLQSLRAVAIERRFADSDSTTERDQMVHMAMEPIFDGDLSEIEAVRTALARTEIQFSLVARSAQPIRVTRGGYLAAFPLPGDLSLEQLRQRLTKLDIGKSALPEEILFFDPEWGRDLEPRWREDFGDGDEEDWLHWPRHWKHHRFCRSRKRNWPMYHHDQYHSGQASGCSRLSTTTVSGLNPCPPVALPGSSWSVPTVVDGKAYVGLIDTPMGGGRLIRVDLATGAIDPHYFDTPSRPGAYAQGIGGSPAIHGDRVYITNVPGTVHCLHKSDLTQIWTMSLNAANQAANQPMDNPNADCWSSPVVVGDHVYVGCGEGEGGAFGFVYCLDADTGQVEWLFCTDQFQAGVPNQKNHIPTTGAAPWASAPPHNFTLEPDPATGASVWSSCAHYADEDVSRIYVGTGNSNVPATGTHVDGNYGSGVLALDALTGDLVNFYSPTTDQSYRPDDSDIDVCGSPVVFTDGDDAYIGIGAKSGAFFLFDPDLNLVKFRQMLPYYHDDPAHPNHVVPIPGFDHDGWAGGGENLWGVFGTPAASRHLEALFIGIGGYGSIGDQRIPFMRAVHWDTLDDLWPMTQVNGVDEYITPNPPMYSPSLECGLSSPSLVNDLVFVATSLPALYALEASTGHCKWAAPNMVLSGGEPWRGCLGAVIYGNWVVAAAGDKLYIYTL